MSENSATETQNFLIRNELNSNVREEIISTNIIIAMSEKDFQSERYICLIDN